MSIPGRSIVCSIFALATVILIVLVNVGIYRYYRDNVERKKQFAEVNRTLFVLSMMLFIVTVVWLCVAEALFILEAYRQWHHHNFVPHPDSDFETGYMVLITLVYVYFVQYFTMLLLNIMRLYYVFKDSQFEMTKYEQRVHLVLFVFAVLLALVNCAVSSIDDESSLFTGLVNFVCLILIICHALGITAVFAVRLHRVHNQTQGAHEEDVLLSTIRKHCILVVTSVLCSMTGVLAVNLFLQNQSFALFMLACAAIMNDVLGNAVFVMLTFKVFAKQYDFFFGRIDKSVHACLVRTNARSCGGVAGQPSLSTELPQHVVSASSSPRSVDSTDVEL